jgi:low temperature requirement protein LtrA
MAGAGEAGIEVLRNREEETTVSPIELFFDLVYVLAITQLTRYLVDSLSLRGAGEALILLLAIWGAWNYTS